MIYSFTDIINDTHQFSCLIEGAPEQDFKGLGQERIKEHI